MGNKAVYIVGRNIIWAMAYAVTAIINQDTHYNSQINVFADELDQLAKESEGQENE